MTYAGCDKIFAVTMMILALAFNGAACQTSLQNHQDLSPNYAGSLYGIMNTFGSFPGFILPFIIGLLTDQHVRLRFLIRNTFIRFLFAFTFYIFKNNNYQLNYFLFLVIN